MKKLSLFTVIALLFSFSSNLPSIYDNDFALTSLDGKDFNLSQFKGKKVLIVNTASECGYTRQYKDLQELHSNHKDKLVIIGMPCNQFGGQEPGSEKEIKTFCQKNYGVEVMMTSKINVKGDSQAPIYKWLTSKSLNGLEDSSVKWNFQKYLLNENGELIAHYSSSVNPMSKTILNAL